MINIVISDLIVGLVLFIAFALIILAIWKIARIIRKMSLDLSIEDENKEVKDLIIFNALLIVSFLILLSLSIFCAM